MFSKNKISITVLVTSINQRKITIDTANYYSNICNEVILVDEEQPHLSIDEIKILRKKGIKYIDYKNDNNEISIKSIYQKRLIAANNSNNKFIVHSNHDERYSYHGLLACSQEMENHKDLIFCAGQAVAIRKAEKEIYFTRSYENLSEYKNINEVKLRLYNHSELYAPIAHYAVWRKEFFIENIERTIAVHDSVNSAGIFDEVIFEFSADLLGNSKALNELYWVRNRVNTPRPKPKRDKGEYSFKIVENKLNVLLANLNDIKLDILINGIYKNFPNVQTKNFIEKIILFIKLILRKFINLVKKEKKRKNSFDKIENLLNESKIVYDKEDLKYLLNSMNL